MKRALPAIPLALLAISCRSTAPGAIDRGAASCVPPDTVVVAGLDLDRLRASPLYAQLPMAPALTEWSGQASYLLAAFNGQELLTIARGSFRAAPTGWTLIQTGLAVSGSDTQVHRAIAAHKHEGAQPPVLREAEQIVAGKPLWIVARGGIELPLPGNAQNLNPLLARSEYAYLTMTVSPRVDVDLTFVGASSDAAASLEKTLRGFLGLVAATEKRGSATAEILSHARIWRDNLASHASLSAAPDAVNQLLQSFR